MSALRDWLKAGRMVQQHTRRGSPKRGRYEWRSNADFVAECAVGVGFVLAFVAWVWWSVHMGGRS